MNRGDAAAATRRFRGRRVAAAATRKFRGDESPQVPVPPRRRRPLPRPRPRVSARPWPRDRRHALLVCIRAPRRRRSVRDEDRFSAATGARRPPRAVDVARSQVPRRTALRAAADAARGARRAVPPVAGARAARPGGSRPPRPRRPRRARSPPRLARLHALGHRLGENGFDDLGLWGVGGHTPLPNRPEGEARRVNAGYTAWLRAFRDDRDFEAPPADLGERLQYVAGRVDAWLSRAPKTLIHGDFKAGNIFVEVASRRPCVVDWQWTGWGTSAERRSCPLVLMLLCTSRRRRTQSNAARMSADGARADEIGSTSQASASTTSRTIWRRRRRTRRRAITRR